MDSYVLMAWADPDGAPTPRWGGQPIILVRGGPVSGATFDPPMHGERFWELYILRIVDPFCQPLGTFNLDLFQFLMKREFNFPMQLKLNSTQ